MSFIIAIHVGDGLVFASDSRITYSHTSTKEDGTKIIEQVIHFTDSSPKTFLTPSKGSGGQEPLYIHILTNGRVPPCKA